MRKNLLIFIGCIFILVCAYRWGDVKWSSAKDVAITNIYKGITGFMFPTLELYDVSAGQLVYKDISQMFMPVLSTIGQDKILVSGSVGGEKESEKQSGISNIETSGDAVSEKDTEDSTSPDTSVNDIPETNAGGIPNTEEPSTETGVLAGLEKQVVINRQKLQDFDYLRQNFYQVDNSTTIGSSLLNVNMLLGKDLTLATDVEGPQILIYHTHSQEGYKDSVAGDETTSVVAVGEYLAKLLSEQYGIEVLHHKGEYDVADHAKAYSNARPAIEKILAENPTIEVVIDLHRDGVAASTHLVTELNGKPTAQIMFFNGLSRTTAKGELTYLENPYIEDNLAFSFQMQLAAEEYFPDLARRIYLKGYRYNMHLCPKSLLVEVGAQTNSFQEAKNAMEPLAILLAKVLKTDKVP